MKRQILTLILIGSIVIVSFSCKKEKNSSPDNATIENIKVPDNFRWKTTSDYQITFTTPTNGIVEVLNDQGIAYQKAFLDKTKAYVMKINIPAYERKVTIKHSNQIVQLELTAEQLFVNFH